MPLAEPRTSRAFHAFLLAGVSALALVTAGTPVRALPFASAGGAGSASVAAAAAAAAIASVQQAQQATQQSMSSLLRASQAVAAMQQAQAAARALALKTPNNVPNGLLPGGLVPDSDLTSSGVAAPVVSWVGVNTPVQSSANGQTLVTVQQTQQKAIANWSSFNVGQNTTLYFNQSAGNSSTGNSWVVLNRVQDPTGVPSQILGEIKAEGSVYVIDHNGIVFGGASQVNVDTLIASSLNLFSNNLATSNSRFLNGGIGDLNATNVSTDSILLTSSAPGAGDVTIAPGAQINLGTQGLGVIAAPNVTNNGSITAPSGQVALIAGVGVSYDYNESSFNGQGSTTSLPQGTNNNSTTNLRFANYGELTDAKGNDITPIGTLANNGLIQTTQGNITLLGGAVEQNGVAVATTSVKQPGSIVVESLYEVGTHGALNPADESGATFYTGSISFGPNAVTSILPDSDGVTLPSDATSLAPWQKPGGSFGFTTPLPTQGFGIIDIIGQAIDFQGGTEVYAPGQNISASTAVFPDPRVPVPGSGLILLENSAILDVSGIPDTELSMASNLLTVILGGNELADSPLQQADALFGATVTVDMRDSGTNSETGEAWVGTPLANLASYANLVQNSIGQLLVNGGSVNLAANEFVGESGSTINLMGGYLHYLGGMVDTTRLISADGGLYNIGSADPNMTYVGIAGEFTVDHAHWGVTQSFTSSLLAGGYYEQDYIQGGNAGLLSIKINATQDSASAKFITDAGATILDSTILAGAVAGTRQLSSGALPEDATFAFASILPIEIAAPDALPATALLPSGFTMASPLLTAPGSAYDKANVLDSQLLNGFSAIELQAGGNIPTGFTQNVASQSITEDAGASLTVQPGGSITISADNATIDGTLIAHSGTISITSTPNVGIGLPASSVPGDIMIGPDAVLDVSGLFVDDRQEPLELQGNPVLVNAGSISLVANYGNTSGTQVPGASPPDSATDLTGNITLAAGSLLDLQSGGHVLANGQLQMGSNDVPVGAGGNLTLETYVGLSALPSTSHILGKNGLPQRGVITTGGTIEAQGFTGGGTLNLEQIAFQIGGSPVAMPSGAAYFDPGHWGELGFGSFALNAITSISVPDDTIIQLQHQNLLPSLGAQGLPFGADAAAISTPGFLTGTELSPTNLTLAAGLEAFRSGLPTALGDDSATIGAGAQILADPGANVSISSYAMTSILGTIRAPGGSISLAVLPTLDGVSPLGPLYVGPQSVLDVSGTLVLNPLAQPVPTAAGLVTPRTGNIYSGGTINLTDGPSSILVAPGAILDVAGASGTFDVPQLVHGGLLNSDQLVLTQQSQWSDGGAVNITGGPGLLFDGTLEGQGGAPQASGGTLSITATVAGGVAQNSSNIVLVEDTTQALEDAGAVFNFSTFRPTIQNASTSSEEVDPALGLGTLVFGADRLNGSGFASLVVNDSVGLLDFSGKVALTLSNSVAFNVARISASKEGILNIPFGGPGYAPGDAHATGGATLTVNAPYIALNGVSSGNTGAPSITQEPSADGILTLNASQIDISAYASLEGIGQANFNSTGDIRLLPAQFIGSDSLGGYLETAGNLTFDAADIYPATDTAFVIQSVGADGTVTFGYPAGGTPSAETPLSADGALVMSAANIVQDGELQAPFGVIILGVAGGTGTIQTVLNGSGLGNYIGAVNTQSVTLGDGSITSVSANGAIIPFGTTVDQTTWNYNPAASNPTWGGASVALESTPTPVTAAPQGTVILHGASIAYGSGSAVDINGGGDLQAQEWIPGTGGSRDVLSQFNTSYANSTTGVQVPLFPDSREIFAIVPGYSSKVAPYDATMSQAGIAPGEQIYLAGGAGLAAGYYTLLPAKYATLPGAFRVVVNSGVTNPLTSPTLADGTMEMSGYLADGFDGAHSSELSQFMVQSAATWGRYSQYALTSANSFFPSYAAENGLAAPNVPDDAGHLIIAAADGLTLGGTLMGSAGPGGMGGQVDISSQFLEITGDGETVAPGYIGISADALDALGASSLLIGGTRTETSAGTVITPTANGIIVANDAADPLAGEQIFLVAAPQFQSSTIQLDNEGDTATIQTPVAGTGLVSIRSGSVIEATGSGSDVGGQDLILGSTLSSLPVLPSSVLASSTNAQGQSTTALSLQSYYKTLDMALGTVVEVSSGAPDALQLPSASQISPGTIAVTDNLGTDPSYTIVLPSLAGVATGAVIQSGANIDGGNVLELATTGDSQVQSGALLLGKNFSAISGDITFVGSGAAPASGMVIDADLLAQLEQSSNVDLQSYGAIAFQGDVTIAMAAPDGALTLSGGTISGDGAQVTISAPTVVFENILNGSPSAPAGNTGTLSVDANQVIFGLGAGTVSGFASATMTAQQAIIGQSIGSTDFGAMPVTLQTPTLIADTASGQTITTTGALSVVSIGSGTPSTSDALGGAITLQGGSVTVAVPIQAQGGNITLQSSAGDVTITGTGALIAHGMAKQFGDTTEYASGGAITLSADQGTVNIQSGAIVDFAGAANGGDGGSLSITTTGSTTPVNLSGTLLGAAAPGFAGSTFTLDSAGAADLDSLAAILTGAGVTGGIGVQTGQGDLSLSGNLTASQVTLVANGGLVIVGGTIDASGTAGGTIELFGTSGVDVEGSLLARASDPTQLGGTVEIGTSGNFDPATGTYNAQYGYENLATSGSITIGPNALIDVSGGTKGSLSGGTVLLRAPILVDGSVNVVLSPTAVFSGARSVGLEAYATWSAADTTTGAQHFDGIVDPSGWYDNTGTLLAGSFVDSGGNVLASWSGSSLTNDDGTTNNLSYYLANDYFQPDAANTDHESFYGFVNGDATAAVPGTLMSFVQAPGVQAIANSGGIANFQIIPGIELANPVSAGVNNGDIRVLTNWNLGAENAAGNPLFRFNGVAPHITFRAGGNVQIDASITDGFHQLSPIAAPPAPPPAGGFDFLSYNSLEDQLNNVIGTLAGSTFDDFGISLGGISIDETAYEEVFPALPSDLGIANMDVQNGYYGAYEAYDNIFLNVYGFGSPASVFNATFQAGAPTPPASVLNLLSTANAAYGGISSYSNYLTDWQNYFTALGNWANGKSALGYVPVPPLPPPVTSLAPPIPPVPTPTNAPDVISSATNSAAIAGMSLASDASSSSYRIVAGANTQSADPLAVNTAATGNVTLDGHTDVGVLADSNAVIAVPTIVRTGTGSIDIAAAGDFELLDQTAPGVVYTAGTIPSASTAGSSIALGEGAINITQNSGTGAEGIGVSTILTPEVNPDNAGNITLNVGGDIIGFQNVIDTLASGVHGGPGGSPASGLSSDPGAFLSQFWLPWLLTNPADPNVPWYVNFGSFDQGIMSIGGNVTIEAGGNIRDLAVSLPTTSYLDSANTLHVTGGGILSVSAGGNIYSGDFYVGQGTGNIRAGGAITSDFTYLSSAGNSYPVETLLAVQYGTINVQARQSADIGGVYDPTYLWAPGIMGNGLSPVASNSTSATPPINLVPYVTSMSAESGASVEAVGGDVTFNSLVVQGALFGLGQPGYQTGLFLNGSTLLDGSAVVASLLLPASLNLVSMDGGITIDHGGGLYPSATGTLTIVANQSIDLAQSLVSQPLENAPGTLPGLPAFGAVGNVAGNTLGKLDDLVGTGILPTASSPDLINASLLTPAQTRDPSLVVDGATASALIYSQNGSIADGSLSGGKTVGQISLIPNAPAEIYAGLDILDLPFFGENFDPDDITSIIAGRDIRYNVHGNSQVAAIEIAGPGTLDVQAGRNLNLQTQRVNLQGQIDLLPPETGIRTIGNSIDASANPLGQSLSTIIASNTNLLPRQYGNPYLPTGGASVNVLFGVAPGINAVGFFDQYFNPANFTANGFTALPITSIADLLNISPEETFSAFDLAFRRLSPLQQDLFDEQILFEELNIVGVDYNTPSSPFFHQYNRGYQAINTLFPSSLGYTQNDLGGGTNGANQLVETGTLDMRGSTIQTQQGGNISILGPGGEILVGSASAAPAVNPASEGILTLEKGNISTFTDSDVLVAQSRIMTEQGGNILMWSSNGNLDAGKGAKTSVSAPPPKFDCDIDWICSADIKGAVSGAGIATLQSLPGVPVGDANLIAPRGTVNAGAAGVRVSGNLNIAALQVLNAFNIQVQGVTVGIPGTTAPNIGALTSADNSAGAATKAITQSNQGNASRQPSILIVEIEGYGGDDGDNEPAQEQPATPQKHNSPKERQSYNRNSAFQVIELGNLTR